jgi:hypothetical protein
MPESNLGDDVDDADLPGSAELDEQMVAEADREA